MKQIYARMIIGGMIGFFVLFIPVSVYTTATYSTPLDPNVSTPSLMISLAFGFIGLVAGSLISLLKTESRDRDK